MRFLEALERFAARRGAPRARRSSWPETSTSPAPTRTCTPRSARRPPSASFRRSGRCSSGSSATASWTSRGRSIPQTTSSSPGGRPGATCGSATSAGGSTTSWRARPLAARATGLPGAGRLRHERPRAGRRRRSTRPSRSPETRRPPSRRRQETHAQTATRTPRAQAPGSRRRPSRPSRSDSAATTAVFSLVRAVLLHPLPYREPGRLAVMWQTDTKSGVPFVEVSLDEFEAWREQAKGFAGRVGHDRGELPRQPLRPRRGRCSWRARLVSGNFFELLGVKPALGRTFTAARRTGPAAPPVAILISHGLWVRQFGSDPGIVGQSRAARRRSGDGHRRSARRTSRCRTARTSGGRRSRS